MPRGCCCNRHKLHLVIYGSVSMALMGMGLLVSVYAIFRQGSQLAKMWLAGPTTIAVGLVLCGKVVIDWGPPPDDEDEEDDDPPMSPFGPLGQRPTALGGMNETNEAPPGIGNGNPSTLVNSLDAQYVKDKQDRSLLLENLATTTQKDQKPVYSVKPIYQSRRKKPSVDKPPSPPSEVWSPRPLNHNNQRHKHQKHSPLISPQHPDVTSDEGETCVCLPNYAAVAYAVTAATSDTDETIANGPAAADKSLERVHRPPNRSDRPSSTQTRGRQGSPSPRRHAATTVDNNSSPIYQGVTFVLHDRQYLV